MLLGVTGQLKPWETLLSRSDYDGCELIHASYQWDELKVSFLMSSGGDGAGETSGFEMLAPVVRHAFSGVSESYHLRDIDSLEPLFRGGTKTGWSFEAESSIWLGWLAEHEPALDVGGLRHFVVFAISTSLHMICPKEPVFRRVF